jgi:enoyl-CoA hydratase/carnithine racemase
MSSQEHQDKLAQVVLEVRGNIAYIHFDHVAARNAMTVGMYQSLQTLCMDIAKKPEIRVLVLRGAGGKSFVAGSDIAQFADFQSGQDGIHYEERIDQYLAPLAMLPIPTIAVIEGMAVGGGLAIATCCDFRIATPDARFGVPIAKTLGNCLSASNLAWLVSHLGVPIVKRMLLLAEMISAPELLKQGYLQKICEPQDLDQEIYALAERLKSLAPITQKSSKLMLARQIANQATNCQDLISETYASADFKHGVTSFLSGVAPRWTGK